jgi:hypothetical protein
MSTGAVIAIVVVIVVVIAAVALGAMEMRRRRLRQQFGPEYDRVVSETGSRRRAEAELSARQRRVAKLDIRPLTGDESARYQGEWNAIQERFVDTPTESVTQAATLVTTVMRVRGYPTDDHDEAMDALSVDHAPTLTRYREARAISERAGSGAATTDDLRNAMLRYRELFHELLGTPSGTARGAGTNTDADAVSDTTGAIPDPATAPADAAPPTDTTAPVATETPVAAEPPAPAETRATDVPASTNGTSADPAGPVGADEAASPQRSTRG